jgi:PAS domain S-box-containing protein
MQDLALLREILDAQLEMVCRFRADGTIVFVNRAYAASIGSEPRALTGRNLWHFVSDQDRAHVLEQVSRLTPDNTEVTIENRFETAQGPRWILWKNHALGFDAVGNLIEAQSTGIDITERKELEERTTLLIEELNHRVKNTLMVVQAMAHQSFRGKGVPAEPLVSFGERLSALAAAHTTLSEANWAGAPIDEVIRRGVAICGRGSDRVTISGPEFMLLPGPTVPLVLALHELSTNALKYGALSQEEGKIAIQWTLVPETGWIDLVWRESGGPVVTPPACKGFGSRLITDAVSRQLGGVAELTYDPAGVSCNITFPVAPIPIVQAQP